MTPPEAPLIQTTFRVGRRWRVTMRIPPLARGKALEMTYDWHPGPPDRRLNKREMNDYRRGRNAALAEVARLIGGNVLCVEAGLPRWRVVSGAECARTRESADGAGHASTGFPSAYERGDVR